MATIIHELNEVQINDGEAIIYACNELGVPFTCRRGKCGSCTIKIISGMENLSSKDAAEEMIGLDENERLACRCHIEQGEVEIDF